MGIKEDQWKLDENTENSTNTGIKESNVPLIAIDDITESVPDDQDMEVFINRVNAVTIRAPILVEGQEVKAVIDTGAEVTVISTSLFEEIPEGNRPKLQESRRCLVVAEEGKRLKTQGVIEANLTIGKLCFRWEVYVAPIRDKVLLGCDIIDTYNITINTKKGIEVGGTWVGCEVIRKSDRVARVYVKESVTVPANSEIIIEGIGKQAEYIDTRYASLEPVYNDIGNVVVARSLVDPFQNRIPVRLANLESFPVKLEKNHMIGEMHPVIDVNYLDNMDKETEVCSQNNFNMIKTMCSADVTPISQVHAVQAVPEIPENWNNDSRANVELVHASYAGTSKDSDDTENKAKLSELPEYLVDLYKRSCTNLKDELLQNKLHEVLMKHQEAFAKSKTDLGRCSLVKHRINTKDATPVRQPLRRTPKAFEGEEEKYLQDQLQAGVITPSKSSWASPVVLVRKKDQSVRWCIDYRKVNDLSVKDAYPIPRIDMCLDCLSSASIFSIMDLQSGYWQLEIEESDRDKTAFITKYGLFEYKKMPFGLCNAPSTFQRCVELILRGLQWKTLLIYIDDIVIYSSDLTTHIQMLDEVLSRLSKAGLKLKPTKCDFFRNEVLFLGHVISDKGIKPNPSAIQSIKDWKEPKTVKQVQQFLGFCGYYRQFVRSFSELAAPLSRLTRKDVKFKWDTDCQSAFNELKHALCTAPILAYPRDDSMYILDTDASNVGIGAVLSQNHHGVEKVIAYGSKKLDPHQQRYSVTRRELLAVITFMHQYRHYLLGKRFLLRTDHGSLKWLFNFKDPQGQVARWLEVLSQYNFDIQHRAGKKHQNADGLSRKDGEEVSCEHIKTGNYNPNCFDCQQIQQEWHDFKKEVDDVTHLGRGELTEETSLRVVTRSQSKKEPEVIVSNWFTGNYSPKELEVFQREDNDLQKLHEWKDSGTCPGREQITQNSPAVRKYWLNFNLIARVEGVLYQKIVGPGNETKYQLLVPRILRQEVIVKCHDHIFGAHMGINKTTERLKSQFHWYGMGNDVRSHIQNCQVCNRFKKSKQPKASLQNYIVGHPMDRIALDVIGPLPRTSRNNQYILVIGDHFSRWMEAYPLPNQMAEKVAEKLVNEFISRFGVPLEIHTDQGSNFESDLFKEVCSLLEVKKTRSTPYRPSSNGLIEKFNQTLENMIKGFVNKNKTDWDQYIGLLMGAYRSTIHPATGFTPNYLMFGREVYLPNHIMYPFPKAEPLNQSEYATKLRQTLEDVYIQARKNLQSNAVKQKRDYDSRLKENSFKVGSLVYKSNTFYRKLDAPWKGPYVIVEILSPVVYKIRDQRRTEVIHHDRLKPHHSSNIPDWAKKTVFSVE